MSDDQQNLTEDQPGLLHRVTEGGVSATHPPIDAPRDLAVAPVFTSELNTLQLTLIPKACWKLEDLRFAFDSSFVMPETQAEMPLLAELIEQHTETVGGVKKRPPLSIFGHTDPVGKDEYNKTLGGRRSMAIYAMLTRRADLWEKLYQQPFGGDDWKNGKAVAIMFGRLGFASGSAFEDTKAFQTQQGLAADGVAGAQTREALFLAYMDAVCGADFKLEKEDFLARGRDPEGKGDYQGCGEFNPVRLFSQQEEMDFSRSENKTQRNQENAPNRRVMVFLFSAGRQVNPERWPCPRIGEGTEGCLKRFFADADRRRANGPERREFKDTHDTFACRFYHRLAVNSPCERPLPAPSGMAFISAVVFFHQQPIADLSVQFFQVGADGGQGDAVGDPVGTDQDGVARLLKPVPIGAYICQVQYQPPTIVNTVPDVEEPFILVLPIGRPYYDFENDFEFKE